MEMTDLSQNNKVDLSQEKQDFISVAEAIRKRKPEYAKLLPPGFNVDKFISSLMITLKNNPQLLKADRVSLISAANLAAQDRLMLDGKEAAAVTFNSKAGLVVQYMPMVGGLVKKMLENDEIKDVRARIAYENDLFEYELGDNERIVHKPLLEGNRGNPSQAYCIVEYRDGRLRREVMSAAEIEKTRQSSKAANSGAWRDWWSEMAKKTVIKRIAKMIPTSDGLSLTIDHDNEATGLPEITPVDAVKEDIGIRKASNEGEEVDLLDVKVSKQSEDQPL